MGIHDTKIWGDSAYSPAREEKYLLGACGVTTVGVSSACHLPVDWIRSTCNSANLGQPAGALDDAEAEGRMWLESFHSPQCSEGDREWQLEEERRDTLGTLWQQSQGQTDKHYGRGATDEQFEVVRGSCYSGESHDFWLTFFPPKMRWLTWKSLLRNGAVTTPKAQYNLLLPNNLLGKECSLGMWFRNVFYKMSLK